MSPGLCIQCASFDSWYVKGVPNRAPNCPKSHAALVFTTLHLHTEKTGTERQTIKKLSQ